MRASVIIADGTFPCTTAPLQGSLEDTLKKAAEIGYDAIQLTVNHPSEIEVNKIRQLKARYGLAVSALATGRGYQVDGLCLGSGDEENRRAAVQRMKGHIEVGGCLDGAAVIIGAIRGWTRDAGSPEKYHSQFDRSIEELVSYAEKQQIVLLFEANDHLETDAYITIRDTAEYIRRIQSPSLRLQLDTMHMLYENEEIYHQVRNCADILNQVDISEKDRGCPGKGSFDFPLLMRALKDAGFQGDLTFEFRPEPPAVAAKAGWEYIRSLMA